jgi:chaperonin cofactor prefoldin
MGITNPLIDSNENKWAAYPDGDTPLNCRSKSTGSWIVAAVLVAVLAAAAYYGYSALNVQKSKISELFGSQSAQNVQDALTQRVDTAENNLRELAGGSDDLGQRVKTLENKIQGNLQQSRKYAETLTQQLHQQLSAELEARTSVIDSRLRQVEAEQNAQRSQLAALDDKLDHNATSIASVREADGRDLSGVHQQIETNARDLSELSERLYPKRVDFELNKGQTEELAPGIVLRISGTNTQYQRYRGSLWLVQDGRTLWLRDQSVHEPVRFFHKESGDPYELVVTDVSKKIVTGYLLVPVQQAAAFRTVDRETTINTTGDDATAR